MSTDLGQIYGWDSLPWCDIEADVFKLQRRIYQASARGDIKKVRSIQKLLLNNRAAKLLDWEWVLERYNPNGTLDTTFGTGGHPTGVVQLNLTPGDDEV